MKAEGLALDCEHPSPASKADAIDHSESLRHYLDITGEYAIFEMAEALSDKARAAGIMLMPGVGWDVIPSDCIALHTSSES